MLRRWQSAGIEKSLGATGLVGAKETGEPPTSRGESGLSSLAEGMALHLWSLMPSGDRKSENVEPDSETEERFCCVTSSHSKSEHKNLSTAVKQKFAQRGRKNWHANVEVDSESDEKRCPRGTSMASLVHELDVCFLLGSNDDHGEYLPPLLVIEESDDDCTRQMQSDVSAAKTSGPISVQTRFSEQAIRRGPTQHE